MARPTPGARAGAGAPHRPRPAGILRDRPSVLEMVNGRNAQSFVALADRHRVSPRNRGGASVDTAGIGECLTEARPGPREICCFDAAPPRRGSGRRSSFTGGRSLYPARRHRARARRLSAAGGPGPSRFAVSNKAARSRYQAVSRRASRISASADSCTPRDESYAVRSTIVSSRAMMARWGAVTILRAPKNRSLPARSRPRTEILR